MEQIPPEKTRDLLSRFGSCCPQEPQTPAEVKLPEHILKFYREVGPSNIKAFDYFIPSLANLVNQNAKYLEQRRFYADFGKDGCLVRGTANDFVVDIESFIDDILIVFYEGSEDVRSETEHVVSLSGMLATHFQLEGGLGGVALFFRELDMSLSTVAASIALAEIVSAQINPEVDEEKWFVEMDRQMSEICADSVPWRERLEDLFWF